jgi:DUF1365 family protein
MTHKSEHIAGTTTHVRQGAIRHAFAYGVDYVLIDPEERIDTPRLFSRNRFNLFAVHDGDHGGALNAGRGAEWAREILTQHGISNDGVSLRLLTQPRFLGYGFNPVSFWMAMKEDELIAVIAEVSTPFGDRHSYLCHLPNLAPIVSDTWIKTPKSLHVSPFQDVAGSYEFNFNIVSDHLSIRILYRNGKEGVVATLAGARVPLTNARLLLASLRRPLGALRTTLLIYWQALRLKLKGATYRSRPTPPRTEVT